MYNTDLPSRAELPSSGKLLRSTAIAALIATGLLVTTVLPAEYGIDPTGVGSVLGLTKMGERKAARIAESKAPVTAVAPGVAAAAQAPSATVQSAAPAITSPASPAPQPVAPSQLDTTTITLKPDQATEIKLVMRKDGLVRYQWTVDGGTVNYDTHGDQGTTIKYHGYGKGKNSKGDVGTLKAAFDGKHGWYWRNRSGATVTITLKTDGAYEKIVREL